MSHNFTVEEIHQGDIGTRFQATFSDSGVPVDLSTASVLEFRVQPPGNAALRIWTAQVVGDPTAGEAQYTTQAGDLDLTGWWKLQGYAQLNTGTWNSNTVRFRVYPNL